MLDGRALINEKLRCFNVSCMPGIIIIKKKMKKKEISDDFNYLIITQNLLF
jgi:hypothetical protein